MLGVRSQILCCYHGEFSSSCDVCCCLGVLLVMSCNFFGARLIRKSHTRAHGDFTNRVKSEALGIFFLFHRSTPRIETADAIPDRSISSANVLDTLNFWHMHGPRHLIWPQRLKLNPGCIPSTDPGCAFLISGDTISAHQASESRTPTVVIAWRNLISSVFRT